MNWADITEKLLTALLAAATIGLPPLIVKLVNYLSALADVKLTQAQQSQLEFAARKAVADASERFREARHSGAAKQVAALQTAHSLAPKAMAKLDQAQQVALIRGTYAEMRPSLSTFTPDDPLTGDAPLPPPARLP